MLIPRIFARLLPISLLLIIIGGCEEADSADFSANINGDKAARLAIIGASDFMPDATGATNDGLPDELVARITERLNLSRRFTLLERTALRRVVLEQRVGQSRDNSDIDRLLNKAVADLESIDAATLAVAANISSDNDALKDLQDLGNAANADYLVYAKLEKLNRSSQSTAIPYSASGKSMTTQSANARLYLRVIDVASGSIVGAASLRTQLAETNFAGSQSTQDRYSVYDLIGRQAASKIIDMVYPARIVGADPLVINRGNNDAVQVNDIYNVFREGKEVKDADGIILGKVKSQVGQVQLTQVQDTLSLIKVLSGTVNTNDLLELSDASTLTNSQSSHRNGTDLAAKNTQGKATLAVGKFSLNSRSNNTLLKRAGLNRVVDDLIVKLSQTRRFEVMERQQVDQLIDEKTFSAVTQGGNITDNLQQLVGADYLIYGTVADFYIQTKNTTIAALDTVETSNIGIIEANLRIVDVHTGKVVAAEKIRFNKKLTTHQDKQQIENALLDEFTSSLVNKVLTRLHPIKVLGMAGNGNFYINRGRDSGLRRGDQFTVLRAGEMLTDPDTGVEFGAAEMQIATAELTNIEAGRSIAKIITGSDVIKGDILRTAAASEPRRRKKVVRKVNKPSF